MTQFLNYIDGAWIAGADSTRNMNPSDTDDVVGEFAVATADQADAAVAAARCALPAWRATTPAARGEILGKVAAEMLARREELGELLSREEGKVRADGVAEVARAAQVFAFFAGETIRSGGEKLASVRADVDVEITRHPVGVVGIITPWNFPIAIPAWKIAPALAFGNTVVVKPAELVPASTWHIADMLSRAGLPDGVFNLLMGDGARLGPAIINGVDALTFTGSAPTGRLIAAQAATKMVKLQLEMGGKNPLIVLDDADLDTAVGCALNGAFFQTGQRCTASSRLIVGGGIHDRFVSALSARMTALRVGHALEAGSDIGPVVDERQLETDLRYIRIGDDEGARRIGGERVTRETNGFFLSPALFTETHNDMRINREEIFGPVASVMRVKDYDEALAVANDTEFGLSAGICTTSLKYARHFQSNVQSGLAMVNVPTAGIDYHVPFGGMKASSFGPREQGRHAADFYTVTKTSYISS